MTRIATGENSIRRADNSAGESGGPSGRVNREGPVHYPAPARDAARASGCSARPRTVPGTLSICFCPVHRNHRVKSSSTIMTAGNYKALRLRRDRRPVTGGINVPTCAPRYIYAEPRGRTSENGFVTRKSHPHFYRSACNFRECLTFQEETAMKALLTDLTVSEVD